MKTLHRFDWERGNYTVIRLSRSFDTLEDAQKFANGKTCVDIYKSKGRYRVEWLKATATEE